MNAKLLAASGLIATGLAYMALQPKADVTAPEQSPTSVAPSPIGQRPSDRSMTVTSQMTEPANSQPAIAPNEDADGTQDQNPEVLVNEAREEKIRELVVRKGSDAEKYVEVQSIECKQKVCIMEASSKGDDHFRFQPAVAKLVQENPWLGNKIIVRTEKENPAVTQFTFLME